MDDTEEDPKALSDRIGRTTLVIDALKHAINRDSKLLIEVAGTRHAIDAEFQATAMRAIHAVLMQGRAIDAVMLARASGVPAAADESTDFTIVIQSARALPPADGDGDR